MTVPTIPGMSSAQVARELQVTTTYVRLLLSEGRLKYANTALGRLIDADSVAEFQAKRMRRKAENDVRVESH